MSAATIPAVPDNMNQGTLPSVGGVVAPPLDSAPNTATGTVNATSTVPAATTTTTTATSTGETAPGTQQQSQQQQQQQQAPFHSASLYVGDLAPDVNEGLLFEIFNTVGPVSSIRVCRDAVTRRSLGYAYINFHQAGDAERALDTMNYSVIKGKPCRIMWSQRDPSLRRSGVGNIFVKNLNESIDNKQLYDTFSLFGNILSCKVVTDRETGLSKGYGYVHYETAEAAQAAIEKLDGMLIDGQEVQVGAFMRRNERPGQSDWTNCFVKNLPTEWSNEKLKEVFSVYGEVTSATVQMGVPKPFARSKKVVKKQKKEEEGKDEEKKDVADTDAKEDGDKAAEDGEKEETTKPDEEAPAADEAEEEGPKKEEENAEEGKEESEEKKLQSLGYGFVSFADHECAVEAVEQLNGKEFETVENGEKVMKEIYVGRAQKKAERERELRAKFEAEKLDRISKFQGVNLYVKNLDDTVTDDILRDEFSAMGTITSARVMKDMKDGRSRGFGFVCYSTPEEATRAVNEMNGKIVSSKPIFVALAQRREVRRAQLEAQHSQRAHGGQAQQQQQHQGMMRGAGGGPGIGGAGATGPMGYMPMYMGRPGPGGSMQPAYPMMQPMMGGPQGAGRTGMQAAAAGRGGYPMMQQQRGAYPMPAYGGMPGTQPGRGGRGMQQGGRGGRGGRTGPGMQQQGRGQMGPGAAAGGRGGQGQQQQPQQQQQQANIKFNQQARNAGPMQQGQSVPPQSAPQPQQVVVPPPQPQQTPPGAPAPQPPQAPQPPPPAPPAANESLTASALASASPEMQKNMIGERLYPLIHHSQPELAGKITGMLLEMDNSELLHLLESPDALNAKIAEALQVLEAHNAQTQGGE